MWSSFFQKYKGKIFAALCAASVIYILVHFFVIEKYQYEGFGDLISQAREHFFHVLPITIAFTIFVIADIKDRLSRRPEKAQNIKN